MSRHGRNLGLKKGLDSLVRRLDRGSGGAAAAARVAIAWEKVSGEMMAGHTSGVTLKEGVLLVHVDGNSWASYFAASSEQYRRAVNDELGQEEVKQVKFIVSRGATQSASRGREEDEGEAVREAADSLPLNQVEMDQVRASVAIIPDEELRSAVLRATVKDLERKKGLAVHNKPPTPRESS
jgi:hypothetical protein